MSTTRHAVSKAIGSGQPTLIDPVSFETVRGERAIVTFTPKLLSEEQITAGVVIRLDDGTCAARSAIDAEKVAHAFGYAGKEIASVAEILCQSLCEHVQSGFQWDEWIPPFSKARIAKLGRVESSTLTNALDNQVRRNSLFSTLLDHYIIREAKTDDGIGIRVRRTLAKEQATKPLSRLFFRNVVIRRDAEPMRVDFLGSRYGCYFLQLTGSHRASVVQHCTERAMSKLFKLGDLRDQFSNYLPLNSDIDSTPEQFEMLVVGDEKVDSQARQWHQIEMLANQHDLRVRLLPDAASAANEVARNEKRRA